MDEHKLDLEIKQLLEDSKDYYDVNADEAKNRIWNVIQRQNQVNSSAPLIKKLVVACIILLLLSSGLSVSLIYSKKELKGLSEYKKQNDNTLQSLKNQLAAKTQKQTDTLVITKTKYIEKPVIITKILTDTIIRKEIVYLPQNEIHDSVFISDFQSMADNRQAKDTLSYTSEVLIRNINPLTSKNSRKMQFRFFHLRDESDNEPVKLSMEL